MPAEIPSKKLISVHVARCAHWNKSSAVSRILWTDQGSSVS